MLNHKTRLCDGWSGVHQLTVQTPIGDMDSCNREGIIAQGNNESGILSSSSLSCGVSDFFSGSQTEVKLAFMASRWPKIFFMM